MKDIFTQALEKALNCEELSPVAELTLEKGRKAQIGEIRDWKGQKYQKQASGQWVPVRQGNGGVGKKENNSFYNKRLDVLDKLHKEHLDKINDSNTSKEWLESTKQGLEGALKLGDRQITELKNSNKTSVKQELEDAEKLYKQQKEELDAINKVLDERKNPKEDGGQYKEITREDLPKQIGEKVTFESKDNSVNARIEVENVGDYKGEPLYAIRKVGNNGKKKLLSSQQWASGTLFILANDYYLNKDKNISPSEKRLKEGKVEEHIGFDMKK